MRREAQLSCEGPQESNNGLDIRQAIGQEMHLKNSYRQTTREAKNLEIGGEMHPQKHGGHLVTFEQLKRNCGMRSRRMSEDGRIEGFNDHDPLSIPSMTKRDGSNVQPA